MQSTVNFTIEYPNNNEELGLTLDTMGKFVVVSQCSSQSELYGLRYQDRIISINSNHCVGVSPNDVVGYIHQYLGKGLTISFQRSFKPDEMDAINLSTRKPLQNDSIFFEGDILFHLGLNSDSPFTEKVVRVVRITGPLLLYANEFGLIPYGIALLWYKKTGAFIPYDMKPLGAQNLLPCLVKILKGNYEFYSLLFACKQEIIISSKQRELLLDFIEVLAHLSKRDLSSLIKDISAYNVMGTQSEKAANDDEEVEQDIEFGDDETNQTKRNLHSTLNIPYPASLIEPIQQIYDKQLVLGLYGLQQNLPALIATGYHPDQITHSITALLFNCKSCLPDDMWDADVRKRVQDIIVSISRHNADYIRTSSVYANGFFVFHCGNKEIEGYYRVSASQFGGLPIFVSQNGCSLFRQIHQNISTWIILKKGQQNASYYIHSSEVIPPRFNWVSQLEADLPAPIVQAVIL